MSVRLEGDMIRLDGACRVEDAEPLLMLLRTDPRRIVDVTGAGPLHAAVVQVLLALQPAMTGVAENAFVTMWLIPLFRQATEAGQ